MAWRKAKDPLAPAEPAYHHPDRCMNCGHLNSSHNHDIGCTEPGGTKYIEDEHGNSDRVCACEEFVAAPKEKGVPA